MKKTKKRKTLPCSHSCLNHNINAWMCSVHNCTVEHNCNCTMQSVTLLYQQQRSTTKRSRMQRKNGWRQSKKVRLSVKAQKLKDVWSLWQEDVGGKSRASSCNWESFLCVAGVCRQKADGAVVELLNDGKMRTSRQPLLVRRMLCQQATHAHRSDKGTNMYAHVALADMHNDMRTQTHMHTAKNTPHRQDP